MESEYSKKFNRQIWLLCFFLVTIIICAYYLIGKQSHSSSVSNNSLSLSDQQSHTKIEIPNVVIDLGKVKRHELIGYSFKLLNKGKYSLIIYDVKADCHCIVPELMKSPVAVKDSTVISVKYDSSQPGFFQKKIMVFSNAENSPHTLIMRGEVSNDVVIN